MKNFRIWLACRMIRFGTAFITLSGWITALAVKVHP